MSHCKDPAIQPDRESTRSGDAVAGAKWQDTCSYMASTNQVSTRMEVANKRTHSRYPMSIVTELIPIDVGEHPMPVPGRTRDISASGAFFWVKEVFQLGEMIKFILTFELPEPATKPLTVQFWGSVVRVEQTLDRDSGIAVAIQRYKFSPDA